MQDYRLSASVMLSVVGLIPLVLGGIIRLRNSIVEIPSSGITDYQQDDHDDVRRRNHEVLEI